MQPASSWRFVSALLNVSYSPTRYQSDDFTPYIYRTTDYGATWTVLGRGIPDTAFVRVVREDPARKGLLYQVRLTAGGKTQTQSFEIRKDPRTSTTPEDFEKQFALLTQIHEKLTVTHDAIADIIAARADLRAAVARSERTPAAGAIAAQGKTLDASLASVQDELVQMNIRDGNDVLTYPAKLNNLIAALAPVVAATDTAPTAQSYEVFKDLSGRLDRLLERLDSIMEREVAAFNKAVEEQHVAAIPRKARKR